MGKDSMAETRTVVRITVSKHARERWEERALAELGLEDLESVARSAWYRGQSAKHVKPKSTRRKVPGIEKFYLGLVFVFLPAPNDPEEIRLVTVMKPPLQKWW